MRSRDEIEGTIGAFVGSWLDGAYEHYGDDFDIGVFALVVEVKLPPEEEGGYGFADIGWTCSDDRRWVQSGLFRRALVLSEREEYEEEESEEDD